MDSKKQQAKLLLKNKEFEKAKQLILDIINHGNHDHKIFIKLGDVCMELNEYDDALKYYTKSMDINAKNSSVYIKIGNLYQNYFNDHDQATKMYETCLKLDPLNEECYFNFAKLLMKQNKFEDAEQFFTKCKTEKACVNYNYALLLLKKSPSSNNRKALKLLMRATELRPNNIQYQYQYALCLQENKNLEKANNAFNTALRLSYYKHVMILYDYSLFLSKYHQDYKSAMEHLEIALNMEQHRQYPQIQQEYEYISEILRNQKVDESEWKIAPIVPEIQLIIYNFEEVISYRNLDDFVDGDINQLQHMKRTEIIQFIFAGYDRIARLHAHFQRILFNNNTRIIIVSSTKTNIIILALKTVGLFKYFNTSDIICYNGNNQLSHIQQLSNKYNLDISTQVLYIDNDIKHIDNCRDHCITFHVFSDYTLNALSMEHMKEIEDLLGVYQPNQCDEQPPSELLPHPGSIKLINLEIYIKIKREIGGVPDNEKSLQSLPVIQFIQQHWQDRPYFPHFMYFAKMFKFIRGHKPRECEWTVANIIPRLMCIEPKDSELHRRHAVSLAYLQHDKKAEDIFKTIIANSSQLQHRLEYAQFLFKRARYVEAKKHFWEVMQCKTEQVHGLCRVYLSYGRTLDALQQDIEAEKYYKMAIDTMENDHRGYHNKGTEYGMYGKFLSKLRRWTEAKTQFEKALNINDGFATYHWQLAKVLYQLKMYQDYEYHLQITLQINANFKEARYALDEYYSKFHDKFNETSSKAVSSSNDTVDKNDVYSIEFDRFWFDGIAIVNEDFNGYYDKFINQNLNDIRNILFNRDVENILKKNIGVDSLQNLQIIMIQIEFVRNEYKEFMKCLEMANLKQYINLFEYHAIYSINALRNKVKNEKDVRSLLRFYNNSDSFRFLEIDNQNMNELLSIL